MTAGGDGATAALLACPQCGSEAYFCDKSDHGFVAGPAIHCCRSPAHNEFHPSEFGRWKRAAMSDHGSFVVDGRAYPYVVGSEVQEP